MSPDVRVRLGNRRREAPETRLLSQSKAVGLALSRIGGNGMRRFRYHYNVILRPEPEGGFTAIVPALPGCVTHGRTLAEAKKMAKDAISGYIESLRKHAEAVPAER
jgi:predicted RNase H-like HicB family nuclease